MRRFSSSNKRTPRTPVRRHDSPDPCPVQVRHDAPITFDVNHALSRTKSANPLLIAPPLLASAAPVEEGHGHVVFRASLA